VLVELLAEITGVGPGRLGARIRRATFRFGRVAMALAVGVVAIFAIVVVTIVVVAGREQ
jgi:hypothetical protein